MLLQTHTDPTIFVTLEKEWRALVAKTAHPTPFQQPYFQRVWWQHFGTGSLLVITGRVDGELVGIASLFVDENRVLRWVGGEEIADYLDFVATPTHWDSFRGAVLEWLLSPASPDWNEADLVNIPAWSDTAAALQGFAQSHSLASIPSPVDVCPRITLPSDWESYLDRLDPQQRRELRRKMRRVTGDLDIRWYIATEEEGDAFLELLAASHPEKAAFLERPNMRAAFVDLIRETGRAGELLLSFLEVGGEKIAAYFCFDWAGTVWVYNSGLRPNRAVAISPGWVLVAHLIAWAIDHGRHTFDFMQGNEGYKYQLGGRDLAVTRVRLIRG